MNDKKRLSLFAMYLLIAIFVLLTVVTCAGVWNLITEPFIIIASILLFLSNGFVTWKATKLVKKWDDSRE